MGRIVATEGKASGWGIGRLGRAHGTKVLLNKRGVAQRSVGLDGEDGEAATAVIGDEHKLPEWIDAQVGRPRALRAYDIEKRQVTGRRIDAEC